MPKIGKCCRTKPKWLGKQHSSSGVKTDQNTWGKGVEKKKGKEKNQWYRTCTTATGEGPQAPGETSSVKTSSFGGGTTGQWKKEYRYRLAHTWAKGENEGPKETGASLGA